MTHIDLERLYREVIPSVVSVYVNGRQRRSGGAGSAFVYDDQHLVTNEHVARLTNGNRSDRVELRFADGSWRVGNVVGSDAYTDLAVIAVPDLPADASPLAVATDNPAPGRHVAALGNPLGLDGSISAGIVSGANRSLPTSNGFAIPDVVQTDAPINPGNSGGPLVGMGSTGDSGDPTYEVVGVNRAKQGDNIGFAVSPVIAQRILPSLVADGRYRHSYLRARTLDVTPTVAEVNDVATPSGVLVVDASVSDGSGSEAILRGCAHAIDVRGRRVPVGGDVIVAIEGRPIRTHEELMRYLITETNPGEPIAVDVLRSGESLALTLVLDERPAVGSDDRNGNGYGGSRIPIE